MEKGLAWEKEASTSRMKSPHCAVLEGYGVFSPRNLPTSLSSFSVPSVKWKRQHGPDRAIGRIKGEQRIGTWRVVGAQ